MALWAKHGKRLGYHPLLYHLIDVSAAALALWDLALTTAIQTRLAGALGLSMEDARTWLAFLAGAHDLGKASVAFARQVPAALSRLDAFGLAGQANPRDAPHGAVSALELRRLLPELGVPAAIAERMADSVGAHHGSIYERRVLKDLPPSALGRGAWAEARHDLLFALASFLDVPLRTPMSLDTATAMWLAGFVSVADWIGSDEQFFAWASTDGSIPNFDSNYVAWAQSQARTALHSLGWQAQPVPPDERSFEDLFDYPPNPMQEAVMGLAPTEQGLVVVEAPMGLGKTEAAFWLADHWSRQLGTRGFYVALPTQATSNQMFTRVLAYLRRRYPDQDVNLQLLHGHASLSAEFEALQRRDVHQPSDIDGGRGDVLAAEWFTHRKRGLLAPYGVGTIDQLLLAVLQTRHLFVRLFGLAGKTVVIDEVHAYDTYMSTLLEQLLRWLAALGSPVVLLSATLPDSRRQALAAAYAEGVGRTLGKLDAVAYPRLTWVGVVAGVTSISVEPPTEHRVGIRWIEDGAIGPMLRGALRDGGVAAVVCNSVARAQEVYTALKQVFPPEELDLLHARYPFQARAERERRALHHFGKSGCRPHRMVLVATQIVEQSLDIDFDVLVTDLAPVDLLLQRTGRLHRHDRPGRPISHPEVWICGPVRIDDGIPVFEGATQAVYDPSILLRTWIVLRGQQAVAIPNDVQALIEAVYDDTDFPSVSSNLQERLDDLTSALTTRREEEERQAWMREIRPPWHRGQLAMVARNPRAEDEPELHPTHQALTRLADLSIPVVLLEDDWTLPNGTRIDPKAKPSTGLVRRLLERSVPLASRRVVYALRDQAVPPGWERSPLLRNHRPIVMPRNAPARVGNAAVSLDPELGVVIEPWKGVE